MKRHVLPVPGRLAPILADTRSAGSWSEWLRRTRSSPGLDRCFPKGLFPVPATTCGENVEKNTTKRWIIYSCNAHRCHFHYDYNLHIWRTTTMEPQATGYSWTPWLLQAYGVKMTSYFHKYKLLNEFKWWLSSVDLFLTWMAEQIKTDLSFQYFRVHAVIGLEYLLCFLLSSKSI